MWDELLFTAQKAFASMALTSDDIFNIVFSLFVAIILGLIISQVYKLTHRGVNYELSFMTSLVMLAPIVALVMFFIRGNLVLSLGLVGSLSIIRFRTPIKDTRDMVYLFWVIAIGLGAGTYNWTMVALASLIILIVIFILYLVKYGRSQNHDYILVVSGTSDYDKEPIKNIINQYTSDAVMRSQNINDDMWEIVFELHLGETKDALDELLKALKQIDKISNVSLLAPQLALPV
ncbi:MAG: DUF4956 domain-containing protein [Brevefilum sp.]|nr:DUF4956 domain-containing protein [Brevefilum sp.]